MKWAMIAIVLGACLGERVGQAAPVDVSLEWIELDCTKSPELAACFQKEALQKCDSSFADLEKRASKRVLVQDSVLMEPGTKPIIRRG